MCVLRRLIVSDSVAPWIVAHQAPLPMEFSRQEYWTGLPFPSPGDLLDPGIKPASPALQADSLSSEPPEKPIHEVASIKGSVVKNESWSCPFYSCGGGTFSQYLESSTYDDITLRLNWNSFFGIMHNLSI